MTSEVYAQELRERRPGSPTRLYDSVIRELEAGDIPTADTLLALLRHLGPPHAVVERDRARLHIEAIQEFGGMSQRQAVFEYYEQLQRRGPRNDFEKRNRVKSWGAFYNSIKSYLRARL